MERPSLNFGISYQKNLRNQGVSSMPRLSNTNEGFRTLKFTPKPGSIPLPTIPVQKVSRNEPCPAGGSNKSSSLMGRARGKNTLQVFHHPLYLKETPYWGNHFWIKGCRVTTLGADAEIVGL